MDPALAPGTSPRPIVFQDGLGERRRIADVSGADTIEQLCLRGELTAIPSFEFALRERASRLANFRHVYYGRVRSVDRLSDPASTLAVVSDSIKGVRLANLLAASERRPMTLDISASVHLIRQLVAAVAMLHENARDVAHGAIGPERIIVTPNARIVIVEYVLGAALEQLHFSQDRYWKELRIPLPPSHGLPRFDHRADVTQVGVVALSLILGRLLHEDEYPARVGDVLASAWAISSKGELEPLPHGLRTWIGRALQLEPRHSFATALEARDELDRVLSGDDDEEEDREAPPAPAAIGSTASGSFTAAPPAANAPRPLAANPGPPVPANPAPPGAPMMPAPPAAPAFTPPAAPTYSAPAPTYTPPPTPTSSTPATPTYSAPAPTYTPPAAPTYSAPAPTYTPPAAPTYSAPAPTYTPPAAAVPPPPPDPAFRTEKATPRPDRSGKSAAAETTPVAKTDSWWPASNEPVSPKVNPPASLGWAAMSRPARKTAPPSSSAKDAPSILKKEEPGREDTSFKPVDPGAFKRDDVSSTGPVKRDDFSSASPFKRDDLSASSASPFKRDDLSASSTFKRDNAQSASAVKREEAQSAFKRDEIGSSAYKRDEISSSVSKRDEIGAAAFTLPAPLFPALDEPSETEEEPYGTVASIAGRPMGRIAAAAVALIVISVGGYFAGRRFLTSGSSAASTGTLNINSSPAGAQVLVDGDMGGVTPLILTLKQGPHNVELRGAGDPRAIPITITAGKELLQYVELPKVTAFGQLQVRSEPAGAQVTVDGIPRGKAPVLVESLAAGEHSVALEADNANVKQTVSVEAGMTASLVVPMTTVENAPVSGWVSLSAPVEVEVFEGKRLVGTSQSDRLMMTAGRHELEIVNETLGYRQVRTVQVPPGKTAPIKLEWPKGSIAINALPWAEVWIDGERIGETPIGNLSLPIGPHEILFRHPDLGEQRFATTVSLKAPARVSVDLRKK